VYLNYKLLQTHIYNTRTRALP